MIPTEAEKGEGFTTLLLKENEKTDASSDVAQKLSRIIEEKALTFTQVKISSLALNFQLWFKSSIFTSIQNPLHAFLQCSTLLIG
jgi:hypothetical protein